MVAVRETVQQVKELEVEQYKYGFETDIVSEKAPRGLSEEIIAFIEKQGMLSAA